MGIIPWTPKFWMENITTTDFIIKFTEIVPITVTILIIVTIFLEK